LRRNPGALAPILSPLAGEIRVRGIVVLQAVSGQTSGYRDGNKKVKSRSSKTTSCWSVYNSKMIEGLHPRLYSL